MKKILVVLLILAVTTGVFAQGEWSIGAWAEVGSYIDLNGQIDDPDNPGTLIDATTIQRTSYNWTYKGWGLYGGELDIGYKLGDLSASLAISQLQGLLGSVSVSADNYGFYMAANLWRFFGSAHDDGWNPDPSNAALTPRDDDSVSEIRRLGGWYSMFDGMVRLEVAVNALDNEYWFSDKTGALGIDPYGSGYGGTVDANGMFAYAGSNWYSHFFEDGTTFAYEEHGDFLLAEVAVGGLQLGLMVPHVFSNTGSGNFWAPLDPSHSEPVGLVDGSLKMSIFGVKFDMEPIEVAAQFMFKDYGIYVGGRFFAGPITAGLSFSGIMGAADDTWMKAGASVAYDGGSFGAGLKAWLNNWKQTAPADFARTVIGVEPNFFINAIPSHLCFNLNAGFYFQTNTDAGNKGTMETAWAVQPEIFWNFDGSGATNSYWGIGTGMIFRYRVFSGYEGTYASHKGDYHYGSPVITDKDTSAINGLDLIFKFSM